MLLRLRPTKTKRNAPSKESLVNSISESLTSHIRSLLTHVGGIKFRLKRSESGSTVRRGSIRQGYCGGSPYSNCIERPP